MQARLAASGGPVVEGNVGAGTGAVSGGVKGGIGTASVVLPNGIIVGALVSLNSEGTAYDAKGDLYAASLLLDNELRGLTKAGGPAIRIPPSLPAGRWKRHQRGRRDHVQLTKSQATKIAEMADDCIARRQPRAHGGRQRHALCPRHGADRDLGDRTRWLPIGPAGATRSRARSCTRWWRRSRPRASRATATPSRPRAGRP